MPIHEMCDALGRYVGRRCCVYGTLTPVQSEGRTENVARTDLEHGLGPIDRNLDGVVAHLIYDSTPWAALNDQNSGTVSTHEGIGIKAAQRPGCFSLVQNQRELIGTRPVRAERLRWIIRLRIKDGAFRLYHRIPFDETEPEYGLSLNR
ncbi:hypothetical protein J2R78_005100 [Bradyrhizobium sp. USDA 4538]|nr:hypothetical protein [Bradyrhizobium sp. USDA 4538]MCP1902697.1 hypothetical protein [Bradyrhizobium sp. USDA 4537]MCP1991646.1 hypothetical protein [Bradyrhizobium sp. USDA 4539]